MKKEIVVVIVFLFLLSQICAMSGDGGNVPVVPKKEAVNVTAKDNVPVTQNESTALTNKSDTNETVKDQFGVNTEKTEDEFKKFKNEYSKKFVELFPNFRENLYEYFFDRKINLNKIDEFKNNGLNLQKSKHASEVDYMENSLKSHVIVTGKIVDLIQKDESFVPRYKLEIDQIVKGAEIIEKYLGEIPKYIYFIAFFGVSVDNESVLNKKGIYFLYIDTEAMKQSLFLKRPYSTVIAYNDSIVCYEQDRHKFDTAFKYKHGKLELSKMEKDNNYGEKYQKWYDECKIGSWDKTIENIKNIQKINDDINFYKRSYKSEEK